jgi:hypothetical protein
MADPLLVTQSRLGGNSFLPETLASKIRRRSLILGSGSSSLGRDSDESVEANYSAGHHREDLPRFIDAAVTAQA